MYKCLDCGHIFEDGEQGTYIETYGLDNPPYKEISCCPLCKGDYEEAKNCEICGEIYLEEELEGGVCDNCIQEYSRNLKFCVEAFDETKAVELNQFLAFCFSKREIEEILYRELEKCDKSCYFNWCSQFVDKNREEFAEKIKESEGK